jgi:hypothetical protein
MGIGASVFLIAAGAIMTFAVETDSSNGFNINNAGVILMVIGLIGLLVSLIVWGPRRIRQTVVEDGPVVRRRMYRDDVV